MQKENTGSTLYVLEAHNRNIKGIDDFGQVRRQRKWFRTAFLLWWRLRIPLSSIYWHTHKYTKLRSVDLSFNQLQALKGFEKLVDLRELKVYANRLASLDGLERYIMIIMWHAQGASHDIMFSSLAFW